MFDRARELPQHEQPPWLQEQCGGDARLLAAVSELLATDGEINQHTLSEDADWWDGLLAARRVQPGALLGKYRVLRYLDSGGVGDVYLAERSDAEIEQTVAVKTLQLDRITPENIQRFHRERAMLSRLEHPGIARLIDVGEQDGLLYCAMEYVDGQPLNTYADAHGLDLTQRIALFLDVCEAVQHAHNRLIIHRDLKPNNILVNREGQAKLLDFGIARPLPGASGAAQAQQTIDAGKVLTPGYAAPEQLLGGEVGIATDVYALGAVLYELLCGSAAQAGDVHSWREAEARIVDIMPAPPSRRVLQNPPQAKAFGGQDERALSRRLRGDLDDIVMHCLKKEPERRYQQVSALVEDLRRHLAHRPIALQAGLRRYRLNKFLRRNWLPVTALSLIAVLLVGFSAVLWHQSLEVMAQRDTALHEQQVSEQVTEFLVETFKSADPTHTLGDKLTARDILDAGVRQLQFNNPDPAVRNRMLMTLGEVHFNLGDYSTAGDLYDRIEFNQSSDPLEQARIRLLQANLANQQQQWAASLEMLDADELPLNQQTAGLIVEKLILQSQLLDNLDRENDAKQTAEKASAVANEYFGITSEFAAMAIENLAETIQEAGNLLQVKDLYLRAHEIMQNHRVEGHPRMIQIHNKLARIHLRLGDVEQSRVYADKVSRAFATIYPDDHAVFIAHHNLLARIEESTGDYRRAIEHYNQAVEINRRHRGSNSVVEALLKNNMASLYEEQLSDLDAAALQYREALEILKANDSLGRNYHFILQRLANVLLMRGQFSEAEKAIQQCLQYFSQTEYIASKRLSQSQLLLADLYLSQNHRVVEALKLLDQYMPIYAHSTSADDPLLLRMHEKQKFWNEQQSQAN